jgi:hypothetical protein
MVSEFRPLIEVLRELKALTQRKTSGYFFIATESNNSSTIRLREGRIEDVIFSRYRNDEAVQQLSKVTAARARFQPGSISPSSNASPLSETALQWLLGGFEKGQSAQAPVKPEPKLVAQSVAAPASTQPPPKAAASPSITPKTSGPTQREIVEKVALNYFGPIATLLCDEAFSGSNDIEKVLAQIASNMPTEEESKRFTDDAQVALAQGK